MNPEIDKAITDGLMTTAVRKMDELRSERDRLLAANKALSGALEILLPVAENFEKQASKGSGGRRGGAVFERVRTVLAEHGSK